jgi:hypothetical protein
METTYTTHTPTPWKVGLWTSYAKTHQFGKCLVTDLEGKDIANCRPSARTIKQAKELGEANAAYIVRAVNAHQELIDLLKQMKTAGVFKGTWSQFVDEAIAKAEGK